MVKVLILNDVLTKGGKERRIVELLKYCKQHLDVHFEIIFMHDGVDFPEIYDTGYKINIIDWSYKSKTASLQKIFNITREYKPDIVHSWASMTDIIGVLLKVFFRKKFISSMIADALPFRSYKNKDYLRSKISFRFADVVTSNTQAGLLSYGAPLSKSVCIYNGFDYNRISHLENPEILKKELGFINKYIIGMVAAFESRKDYTTLLLAAKSLLKKYPGKLAFLLLGTGPTVKAMIAEAGEYAPKDILFTGLLNNVEEYIDTFDIGVLCTNSSVHGEGISNSLMECMALGKPVIATQGGGTAELISDNETGYLIPANNFDCLEEKIVYLMQNKQKAKNMGLAGKARIQKDFAIDTMCNSFYNIYLKLSNK